MTQQKNHREADATRSAVETHVATLRADLSDTVGAITDRLDLPTRARQVRATATRHLGKVAPVARDTRVLAATASAAGLVAGWLLATRRRNGPGAGTTN
ncbi:hypothetical protein R8Z50_15095 [Longispora sp. K20-0274]|uniref:hypothetical protein n=1 Tax=Longispora sp. K20-0274 TaxID=3088255 RepID=UPI00399ADB94